MRRQRHFEIARHRSKPISVVRHSRITSLAEMQIISLYKIILRDASLGGPWRLIAKNTSSVTLPVFQKELYREVDGQSVCEMHHNSIWEALGEDNAGIVGSAHTAVLFYLPGSRFQQQAEQPYIAKLKLIMYGTLAVGRDCYAVLVKVIVSRSLSCRRYRAEARSA
jgi:hypothetical protein